MYRITYRTATDVSRVDNALAGSFEYFADAQDALDTGLFVEKYVTVCYAQHDSKDITGKTYVLKTYDQLTPTDRLCLRRI